MDNKQRVNILLKEFSRLNNVPEFQLNEENVCGFQYLNNTVITLFLPDDQWQLVFLGELAPLNDITPPVLVKVLEYSFPGIRTKGAAISVNPEENTLVLSYIQSIERLTSVSFTNILKNFIETITHFKSVIEDYQRQAPAPAMSAATITR